MRGKRMIDDEDDLSKFEDEEDEFDRDRETILRLGHALDEHYLGDHRFNSVELDEPGQLDGEEFRLKLIVDENTHFFVAVMPDDGFVRVGLATADEALSDSLEERLTEGGESPTEYVARAMELEELDYEVQQFHDDVFYFCSEIPFERPRELLTRDMREEIVGYLEGYVDAFLELLE
jgi:hypothetical protein